ESATRVTFSDLSLVTVTPAIQAERRLTRQQGALVVSAGPESQRTLGLQAGDVILQVNNVAVTSAGQFNQLIAYYRGRGALRLFFERQGRIAYADFWGGR
ncbi:MAG: PDZ domain-containing protein, partial [Gemmatimonadales bacterium]|nr:PDZ domain-containing protein [Gemmatimonadales bacterium]